MGLGTALIRLIRSSNSLCSRPCKILFAHRGRSATTERSARCATRFSARALRRFVWEATISVCLGRCERMTRQVLELGHAQISNGDEGRGCSEAPRGALGLLQHAVHGFDKSIGPVISHASHDGVDTVGDRASQFLEWFQSAASGPTQPGLELPPGPPKFVNIR